MPIDPTKELKGAIKDGALAVGGEVKRYSWQASPGLFKKLNDFVEHKKAVASGGATSELGTMRRQG